MQDPSLISEEDELRAYLGPRYDRSRLERWQQQLEEEALRVGDEGRLYRTSEAYLYNLAVFAASGTKAPYLDAVRSALHPGARVLDLGCGIGSDGIALLAEGYRVEFADFDNPSTRYLRWRLSRRGLSAPVHDVDAGPPPLGFDLAYAFDVLEHVADPFALLDAMERSAALVCVNLLVDAGDDDSVLHHPLPVRRIVWRARRRGLVLDRRFHGRRVRLLMYRGARRRGAPR